MRITLINCDVKLKAMGIDMQAIGSFDALQVQLSTRLSYTGLEYNFPPMDCVYIDVEDGTEVPYLSDFGEVVTDDGSI